MVFGTYWENFIEWREIENMGVTLIIPTKNEIDGLKFFMPKIKSEWYDELIIVDAGSTDGTIEYCNENGYPIIIQSGIGLPNALADAFAYSTKEIIITISPDGNSIHDLIPELIKKMKEGYDMVIVSRYLGSAKSSDDDIFTGFGNKIFTKLINFVFHGKYTDTLVIFRAYRRNAISIMRLNEQHNENWLRRKFFLMSSWEVGSSIRAAKLKLKVAEIPGDEPKRIGGLRKMSIIKNGSGVLFQIVYELLVGCNFLRKS